MGLSQSAPAGEEGIRTWCCPNLLISLHSFLSTICLLFSLSLDLLVLRFAICFSNYNQSLFNISRAFSIFSLYFKLLPNEYFHNWKLHFFLASFYVLFIVKNLGVYAIYSLSDVSGELMKKQWKYLYYLPHHEEGCIMSAFILWDK